MVRGLLARADFRGAIPRVTIELDDAALRALAAELELDGSRRTWVVNRERVPHGDSEVEVCRDRFERTDLSGAEERGTLTAIEDELGAPGAGQRCGAAL